MSSERKWQAEKNCVNLIEDTEENEAANREKAGAEVTADGRYRC